MKIYCPIETNAVHTLIEMYNKKYPDSPIKKNWGYNAIGLWQAKHNSHEYPTVSQLKEMIDSFNKEELITAIPIYNNGENKLLKQLEAPVKSAFKEVALINHSGGAKGSDSYWGEIGKKYGVTSRHYYAEGEKTPSGNTPLSKAELQEADRHLKKANDKLGRVFPTRNNYTNNLLRRNWFQVKNANSIFAVGTISNNIVEGGTGWAVQMAIDQNKPVYVFDQNTEKWYTYIENTWKQTNTPILTTNFAGIGTRNINNAGKKAIEKVYENTFVESLIVTGNSKTTATKAKEIGGIDTLRHPDKNGMHFGNPFSYTNYTGTIKVGSVKESVTAFEQWLRGEAYQDVEPERRKWIMDQINNGSLKGKPLVYYTDKVPDNSYSQSTYNPETAPNHAHILQKLINEIGAVQTKSKPDYSKVMLAGTDSKGNIKLYELIGNTAEEKMNFFFDYISGKIESPTSKQKQAVLNKVFAEDKNIHSMEDLRKLITTPKDVYTFLLWHEQAHILYGDKNRYWNAGRDYMTKDKIDMETRATIDALTKLKIYKKMQNKQETKKITTVEKTEAQKKEELNPPITGTSKHITLKETRSSKLRLAFTSKQIDENIQKISKEFSKTVDTIHKVLIQELQNNIAKIIKEIEDGGDKPSLRRKLRDYNESLAELQDSNTGKVAAVNKYGVSKVKALVRKKFKDYYEAPIEQVIDNDKKKDNYVKIALKRAEGNYEDNVRKHIEHKRAEYKKIVDNFDELYSRAFSFIESRTGISLSNTLASVFTETETDEQGNPIEETDLETGARDNGLIKARFVDPHSTLSKRVKVALSDIPSLNSRGTVYYDYNGNPKYMSESSVYAILLAEAANLIDNEQFTTKDNPVVFFEKLQTKYPWAKVLIKNLKNPDGTYNRQLINEMYSCLRMQFVPYFITRDDYIAAANIESGLEGAFNKTATNIKRGYKLNKSESVYDDNGNLQKTSVKKIKERLDTIISDINNFDELTDDEVSDLSKNLSRVLNALGIEISDKEVSALLNDSERFESFYKDGINHLETIVNGLLKLDSDKNFIDEYKNAYRDLLYNINIIGQEDLKQSFYNGNKQKYSYSTPNYVHKLISHLNQTAFNTPSLSGNYSNRFREFLDTEFKLADKWFFRNGQWQMPWLKMLDENAEVRSKIRYITMDSIDGKAYSEWEERDIYKMLYNAYINSNEKSSSTLYKYAYYHMPIFSDSPQMIMIRMPKFDGVNFKEEVIKNLNSVVKNELYRIRRVLRRAEINKAAILDKTGKTKGIESISNYDAVLDSNGNIKNVGGAEFKFFPQLNDYYVTIEGQRVKFYDFIQDRLKVDDMKSVDAAINQALSEILEEGYQKFVNTEYGKESTASKVFKEKAEEFYYNSVFATTQIIQLTTTDLAFYKNAVDFQKRFKEVYAMGKRLNVNSELGKKTRRVAYLKDQYMPSRTLDGIQKALSNSKLGKLERDYILSKFKSICVTDAQAYLSPKAYRIMLDMMGQLSPQVKESIERFENGTWTVEDFKAIFQTLKPFMFTNKVNRTGLNEDENMRTPLQHKNSEVVIATLYNLVTRSNDASSGYDSSPKLRAMVKFMEEHDIDSFMFSTAVKVGGHSFVDLNYSRKRLNEVINNKELKTINGHELKSNTYEGLMDEAANLLADGSISKESYNKFIDSFELSEKETSEILEDYLLKEDSTLDMDRVDEFPYEDVMIAQENPEHLVDNKKATFGSQLANLVFSDLGDGSEVISVGNTKMTLKQAKELYFSLRSENILEGFSKVKEILSSKEKLSEYLQKMINDNPSYSRDLMSALDIVDVTDPETGETRKDFNLPIHTPSMSKKLSQLVFSTLKNNVTKQYINGGNATLVSDFGLTDELEVEFDKDGNLKGIQCYLPASSSKYFEAIMNPDGTLDVEKLKEAGLDKIIGYRIPTEGKYSMAPLIVKGFLPQQLGSCIMLPSDITTLAGSDFDIDKLFLMIPNSRVVRTINRAKLRRAILNLNDKFKQWDRGKINNATESEEFTDRINTFIDRLIKGEVFESGSVEECLANYYYENKEDFDNVKIEKIKYDTNKTPQEQSKEARDNMIIDLIFNTLTSKTATPKLLSPGNFDNVTHAASIALVSRNKSTLERVINKELNPKEMKRKDFIDIAHKLLNMSPETLNKAAKSLKSNLNSVDPSTFVTFHGINRVGGQMIGIYANSNTHQAKTQNTGLKLVKPVTLFGMSGTELDREVSKRGTIISATSAEWSAASVDDAKEQNLKALNQNSDTAPITALLTRLGYNPIEVGVYLNSVYYNNGNPKAEFSKDVSLELLLADNISRTLTGSGILSLEEEASMQSIANSINKDANALNAHIMQHRADSPNGGIAPTQGAAIAQIIRKEVFPAKVKGVLTYSENLIKKSELQEVIGNKASLRELLNSTQMPMLTAFRALGIDAAEILTDDFVLGMSKRMTDIIRTLFFEAPNLNISDSVVENIINHYVVFRLSETKIFGDDPSATMAQKQSYFLNEFPKVLEKFIKGNEDLVKDNRFLKKVIISTDTGIQVPSPSSYSKDTTEAMKTAAVNLIYDAPEIASGLLMYAYYKDGLQYRANSITPYILTTDFLSNFPEVVDCLRNITKTRDSYRESFQVGVFKEQLFKNLGVDFMAKKVSLDPITPMPDGIEVSGDKMSMVINYKTRANFVNGAFKPARFVVISTDMGMEETREVYRLEGYDVNDIGIPTTGRYFRVNADINENLTYNVNGDASYNLGKYNSRKPIIQPKEESDTPSTLSTDSMSPDIDMELGTDTNESHSLPDAHYSLSEMNDIAETENALKQEALDTYSMYRSTKDDIAESVESHRNPEVDMSDDILEDARERIKKDFPLDEGQNELDDKLCL